MLRLNAISNWRSYSLSLLTFVLAMLSKGSVAIFPLVLLLIAWWRKAKLALADATHTAPSFVVAVVLTGVNIWFQSHGTTLVIRDVTVWQRLLSAAAVPWFYLSKAFLPIDLCFVYYMQPIYLIRTQLRNG